MDNNFATVINCMDGRVQLQVNEYISKKYGKKYIDTITLAGPCKIVSESKKDNIVKNLKFRIDVSVMKHKSEYIFIVGHTDCAGIKRSDQMQKEYLIDSVTKLKQWYPNTTVEAIWLDQDFEPCELRKGDL